MGLWRWLTFRRSKKYKPGAPAKEISKKNRIVCNVRLLDQTDETFVLHRKDYGKTLYEKVFFHLDLLEVDYFGLTYTDTANISHWLDPTKKIRHQVPIGPPFTFKFRVKFYPLQPNHLREDITRYHLFLQLKEDILEGRLSLSFEEATELFALVIQSELGDYEASEHDPGTISEFRFLANQTEALELAAFEFFKKRLQLTTPAQAEQRFCNRCKSLEQYGIDMHPVIGKDNRHYDIGLTPNGLLVYDNKERVGLFFWPKMTKLNFKNDRVFVATVEEDAQGKPEVFSFVFRLQNRKAAKHLWKCCLEYHSFFRLVGAPKDVKQRQGFVRLGSRFRYSGRTEYQQAMTKQSRRSVQFERKPSQRFSRRASLDRAAIAARSQKNPAAGDNNNTAGASAIGSSLPSNASKEDRQKLKEAERERAKLELAKAKGVTAVEQKPLVVVVAETNTDGTAHTSSPRIKSIDSSSSDNSRRQASVNSPNVQSPLSSKGDDDVPLPILHSPANKSVEAAPLIVQTPDRSPKKRPSPPVPARTASGAASLSPGRVVAQLQNNLNEELEQTTKSPSSVAAMAPSLSSGGSSAYATPTPDLHQHQPMNRTFVVSPQSPTPQPPAPYIPPSPSHPSAANVTTTKIPQPPPPAVLPKPKRSEIPINVQPPMNTMTSSISKSKLPVAKAKSNASGDNDALLAPPPPPTQSKPVVTSYSRIPRSDSIGKTSNVSNGSHGKRSSNGSAGGEEYPNSNRRKVANGVSSAPQQNGNGSSKSGTKSTLVTIV